MCFARVAIRYTTQASRCVVLTSSKVSVKESSYDCGEDGLHGCLTGLWHVEDSELTGEPVAHVLSTTARRATGCTHCHTLHLLPPKLLTIVEATAKMFKTVLKESNGNPYVKQVRRHPTLGFACAC